MLEISVKDEGIGLTDQQIQHVFDPFAKYSSLTISDSHGSSLSICRQICQFLDGDIRVFSQVDSGSNFVCTMRVFDCETVSYAPHETNMNTPSLTESNDDEKQ